jgi:hypothetical protein
MKIGGRSWSKFTLFFSAWEDHVHPPPTVLRVRPLACKSSMALRPPPPVYRLAASSACSFSAWSFTLYPLPMTHRRSVTSSDERGDEKRDSKLWRRCKNSPCDGNADREWPERATALREWSNWATTSREVVAGGVEYSPIRDLFSFELSR